MNPAWRLSRVALIAGVLIGIVIGAYFYVMRPLFHFDEHALPQMVTANVVDPKRVYLVSRFRSGAGHDYSNTWDGETCRSMKHYMNVSNSMNEEHMPMRSEPTASDPNIDIYAPFDGWITANDTEHTPIGRQVHVQSEQYPSYVMRIFHVDLLPSLAVRSHVRSGERIATIGPRDGTDISLEATVFPFRNANISYFAAMTDVAFAPWAKMGYKRNDFIITRAYRDAHPLACTQERFERPAGYDWREDYLAVRPNPYRVNEPDRRP